MSGYCAFCETEFENIGEHLEGTIHKQKTKHLFKPEPKKPGEQELLTQLKTHAEKFGTDDVLETACQMDLSRTSLMELRDFIEFGGETVARKPRAKRIIRSRTLRRR